MATTKKLQLLDDEIISVNFVNGIKEIDVLQQEAA